MAVRIAVRSDDPAGDLDDLRRRLAGERESRGRVEAVPAPPPEGVLSPVVDVLLVALGPAGAVTSLAAVLVTWLRRRRPDVSIEVVRADGAKLTISATDLGDMDGARMAAYVDRLAAALDGGEPSPPPTGPDETAPAERQVLGGAPDTDADGAPGTDALSMDVDGALGMDVDGALGMDVDGALGMDAESASGTDADGAPGGDGGQGARRPGGRG
ncbi:effector-associated constant component EACC1 [Sphaerisporangium flaviroseum]